MAVTWKTVGSIGVLIGVIVTTFVVCNAQETVRIRIGHTQPVVDPYTKGIDRFAQRVAKETAGKVQIMNYPAGQLGGEKDINEGVKLGTVQMALVGMPGLKFLDILAAPYIFRDRDHLNRVLTSDVVENWNRQTMSQNMRIIGFVYRTPRHLTTNKAVNSFADLRGQKIRVSEIPLHIAIWKAFGTNPTPMAFPEVFTGLQQGAIDGQENPMTVIYGNSFFQVQKNLVLTGHVWNPMIGYINEPTWSKLSPAQQAIMSVEWQKMAMEVQDEVIQDEDRFIQLCEQKGMKVIRPDLAQFREATKDIWKSFVGDWGAGVYEKIQAVK